MTEHKKHTVLNLTGNKKGKKKTTCHGTQINRKQIMSSFGRRAALQLLASRSASFWILPEVTPINRQRGWTRSQGKKKKKLTLGRWGWGVDLICLAVFSLGPLGTTQISPNSETAILTVHQRAVQPNQ